MIKPRLRSIRHKIFAAVLLTTTFALALSGLVIVLYDQRDYDERLIEDLKTQASLLGLASASALQFNDPKSAADSLAALKARPQILAAAIYSADGSLFATYHHAQQKEHAFPPRTQLEGPRTQGNTLILFRRIIDHSELLGTVYINADYRPYERIWQFAGIVCAVMLLALIISMLLSLWTQATIARPLLNISTLARKAAQQKDYSLRAEKSTDDEIAWLVDSFNDLLAEVGRLNTVLEQRVEARTAALERANRELEAFSYSVSHDLRTPLRAIDGFSQALLEDYGDNLDDTGRDFLKRVRSGAQRMGQLIDDLLKLSRVSRSTLTRETVDISALASEIIAELRNQNSQREVAVKIAEGLTTVGDAQLLRIALENLLNNAWKYTGRRDAATIELGVSAHSEGSCYFVRDNGAGFNMAYADKLFGAFQRLHDAKEFSGTGVGLATVQRIIDRHGGKIWAEAEVDRGSTFYFTLPKISGDSDEHETDTAGGR